MTVVALKSWSLRTNFSWKGNFSSTWGQAKAEALVDRYLLAAPSGPLPFRKGTLRARPKSLGASIIQAIGGRGLHAGPKGDGFATHPRNADNEAMLQLIWLRLV